jgi:hypothetical protein
MIGIQNTKGNRGMSSKYVRRHGCCIVDMVDQQVRDIDKHMRD